MENRVTTDTSRASTILTYMELRDIMTHPEGCQFASAAKRRPLRAENGVLSLTMRGMLHRTERSAIPLGRR